MNGAGYALILVLCNHGPALLLSSVFDVLTLCLGQGQIPLAFGGYSVVGDDFHCGDSLKWLLD